MLEYAREVGRRARLAGRLEDGGAETLHDARLRNVAVGARALGAEDVAGEIGLREHDDVRRRAALAEAARRLEAVDARHRDVH